MRRLRHAAVASTMGLLTALYGNGRIVGPPLAAQLRRTTGSERTGTLSLQIAAAAPLAGTALNLWLSRAFPKA